MTDPTPEKQRVSARAAIEIIMAGERARMLAALGGCRHCGAAPEPDGDHTCPCPHHDNDCPDHPTPGQGSSPGDLAKILHDLAHPSETHFAPGTIYQTMAERLAVVMQEDAGSLYEWLADREGR